MLRFSNFGKALIGSAPSGTTGLNFTVEAGKGVNFPTLDTGDYFYGILKDASGNREIVKIEARSGDAMTIAVGGRGLDGTTARTWNAGDYFVAGLTNVALQESLSNANLIALGALTTAADKIAYWTGAGTAALTTITDFIRSLLAATDAAAARTILKTAGVEGDETIAGIKTFSTPIAIGSGGTGANTAANARANLGLGYGPAFSAYANTDQSVTSGVSTKVTLGTEEEDTASCFASSRFTPNVAGYYFFSGSVRSYSATLTSVAASIAKNGGTVRSGDVLVLSTATNTSMEAGVSALIEMNGSSDFVELYGVVSGGTPVFDYNGGANSTSSFCGFLVRPL